MGLHLSFGIGPIRYSTSSRRRRPTKAQIEANRAANRAALWLLVLAVLIVLMVAWTAVLFVAWLLWLPVAGITAGVKRDGYFKRHWYQPLQLQPWHSKAKRES